MALESGVKDGLDLFSLSLLGSRLSSSFRAPAGYLDLISSQCFVWCLL